MTKILLFANTDWYLYNYRLDLAREIQKRGADILFVSPAGDHAKKLVEDGFEWVQINLSRRGLNPIGEIKGFQEITSIYRYHSPDLVHHFTIKPIIYGSLSARRANVPCVVNAVTGRGYLYASPRRSTSILRALIKPFYRHALSTPCSKTIFQTQRDLRFFTQRNLVDEEHALVIPGSGVDVERFKPTQEPHGDPVILMASRMLWDKGSAVRSLADLRSAPLICDNLSGQ